MKKIPAWSPIPLSFPDYCRRCAEGDIVLNENDMVERIWFGAGETPSV